jgi:ribosomal protein S18 acetylase RimI-like enzyme
MTDGLTIRPYHPQDFHAVVILWRIAREKSLPDFQRVKGYFFHQDMEYFTQQILPKNQIWVAEADGTLAGFMAMQGEFVDQLFIHPDFQRRGIGTAFLDLAREKSPKHVWLYTLQINGIARGFYEKNGFVAEVFGISPPPESEPDIQYHWRPS